MPRTSPTATAPTAGASRRRRRATSTSSSTARTAPAGRPRPRSWRRRAPGSTSSTTSPTASTSTTAAAPPPRPRWPREVVARGADLGFALDGDADRLVVVDRHGRVVDGDQLLGVCALDRLARGALPGGILVVTVLSNGGLEAALAAAGGQLVRTPVGDKYILEGMQVTGAGLGGEKSGHVIVLEHTTLGRRPGHRPRAARHPGPRRPADRRARRRDPALPAGAAGRPGAAQGAVGGGPGARRGDRRGARTGSAPAGGSWSARRAPSPPCGSWSRAPIRRSSASWRTSWLPWRASAYTRPPARAPARTPGQQRWVRTACAGSSATRDLAPPGPILMEGLRRLEYRGYDSAGIALVTEAGELFVEKKAGKLANLATALEDRTAQRRHRPRPHALGHPRPAERPERPSPRGLHRRDHGDPQRDHRELPRAARRARGARPRAGLRDRHGGARPPRRGGLRGRPRGGGAGGPGPRRRRLRHRGHAPRRAGPARRGPHERAPRRRARRRRDVPGLGRGRDPRPHQPGRLPRGGRRRRPAAVGRSRSPTSPGGRASGP